MNYERRPKMSARYNYDCIDCLFYDMCTQEYNIGPTTPACDSFELLHPKS